MSLLHETIIKFQMEIEAVTGKELIGITLPESLKAPLIAGIGEPIKFCNPEFAMEGKFTLDNLVSLTFHGLRVTFEEDVE